MIISKKRNTRILALGTFILVLMLFAVDHELYYYGRSWLNYKTLPFDIEPNRVDRIFAKGSVELRHWSGMSLVGERVRFFKTDYVVEQLIGYGYNNKELIAELIDTSQVEHFIQITEANRETTRLPSTNISHLRNFDKQVFSDKWTWVAVADNHSLVVTIEFFKNLISIGVLIVILWFLFSRKGKNKKFDVDMGINS